MLSRKKNILIHWEAIFQKKNVNQWNMITKSLTKGNYNLWIRPLLFYTNYATGPEGSISWVISDTVID